MPEELPQILDRVELRAVGRQRQQREVVGDAQGLGAVPARLVEDDDRVAVGGDVLADLGQMQALRVSTGSSLSAPRRANGMPCRSSSTSVGSGKGASDLFTGSAQTSQSRNAATAMPAISSRRLRVRRMRGGRPPGATPAATGASVLLRFSNAVYMHWQPGDDGGGPSRRLLRSSH